MNNQDIANKFHENGFVIVKNVFSLEEVSAFRQQVMLIRKNALASNSFYRELNYPNAVFIVGDLLGKRELEKYNYIVFDERVIEIVKSLIGAQITYFGDSSLQTGEAARGFHKDNVDRSDHNGQDWKDSYNVIRLGIYLQDHALHSGGLKVRVKSHKYVSTHKGRAVNLAIEQGDVVVWSLKTSHSGNNIRMKGFPNICLHPRLESRIPAFLRVQEQQERMVMFCSFGGKGPHVERYIEYQIRRGDYHEHWRRSGYSQSLLDLAQDQGVELLKPISAYGSLC